MEMIRRLFEDDSIIEEDEHSNTLSVILSNIFLFFLIFGMSATVDIRNMRHQLTNRFALGCGVLMQFIIMPALGYLAVVALRGRGLSESMGIALLVVTTSPGGSYSNWWCSVFNAELALSVAMTTVSSILSLGLLPGNLMLYSFLAYGTGDETSVVEALDFKSLFLSLGIVLSAILSGLMASYYYDSSTFHKLANRFGSLSGILLILFSVFLSSGGEGSESRFWNQPWAFYVGVGGPCVIGLLTANLLTRLMHLNGPETVAIAIECCYQNTGIATSMAITMFTDPEDRAQAVAVPLFYGFVEAFVIGVYCLIAWKSGWTKAPAEENLCVIMTKTYEVEESQSTSSEPNEGDQEDTEQAMTQGKIPAERQPILRFWHWLFPRTLQQQSTAPIEKQVNDEKKFAIETEEIPRSRLVSTDYTADTSHCSTPSTPQPRLLSCPTIHTLTIPESPDLYLPGSMKEPQFATEQK